MTTNKPTKQVEEQIDEIIDQFEVDIFDLVGDEFAPKQEKGSPERKRLLGLMGLALKPRNVAFRKVQTLISAESRRAREEAKFKYEPDIAWAIGYGRGIGTPLEYLEKRYPHLLEAELKPKSKSTVRGSKR